MIDTRVRLRGVNLGGWLVLEKWMTPSLFAAAPPPTRRPGAPNSGRRAPARLRAHWKTFITRDDFAWLAGVGINAVRIPVGHWIFGPPYPYHPKYGAVRQPFVEGGIDVLDRAFDWADEFGLRVVLDLHAAPGCQNGFDNGGIENVCEWHTRDEYIDHSVDVLGRLAARYWQPFGSARDRGAQRAPLGHTDGSAQGVLPARLRRDPRALSGGTRRGGLSRRFPFAPRISRVHAAAGISQRAVRRASLSVLRTGRPRARHQRPRAQGGRHVEEPRPTTSSANWNCRRSSGSGASGWSPATVASAGCVPAGRRLPRLRCRTTARVRALPRLVLLELSHRNDAGVVLPRVRRTRLASRAFSVRRAPHCHRDRTETASLGTRVSTILRSCSSSSPGWKLIVSSAASAVRAAAFRTSAARRDGSNESVASSMKIHAGRAAERAQNPAAAARAPAEPVPSCLFVQARREPRDAGAFERRLDSSLAQTHRAVADNTAPAAASLPADTAAAA